MSKAEQGLQVDKNQVLEGPARSGRIRLKGPFLAAAVRAGGDHPSSPWGERGAALALTVLFLPVWLALATLAIDVAYIMWVHAGMRAAADLGALAAAQNIDLDALAVGDPEISPSDAQRDARQWILDNLHSQRSTAPWADGADIRVWVLNGKPGAALSHPLTGRIITDPTVAVEVSLTAQVFLVPRKLGTIPLQVRADASVMGRKT